MWHIYFPSVFHNNHAEKKEVTNSFLRLIFPSSNREKTYDTIRLCGKILIGEVLSIYDYIKYILIEKYSVNRGPIFSQISINHKRKTFFSEIIFKKPQKVDKDRRQEYLASCLKL